MGTRHQRIPIIVKTPKRALDETMRQSIALRRTLNPLMDDPEMELIDPEFDSDEESILYVEAGIAPEPRERLS